MEHMEKVSEGETLARQPMDLDSGTSTFEEINLKGEDHQHSNIIPSGRSVFFNCCKKRKPQETSLDAQDPNISKENREWEEEMHKKRKREDPKFIQEPMPLQPSTDELDLMGKIWVMELRKLPLDQQLFAKKAVCDVLFEARLGQLNKNSVRINRPDVAQNYLTCVHEEHRKICACPNTWEQSQQRCPISTFQTFPGHFHCYSKGTWKGNLSSPHRLPFFATHTNRFAAPNILQYPRGPRVGRPIVITTAMNNITTTTIVVVTPRLVSTTASTANLNSQIVNTKTPRPSTSHYPNVAMTQSGNHSRINTVNISPYRVENSTNTPTEATSSQVRNEVTADPRLNTTEASALNTTLNPIQISAHRTVNRTGVTPETAATVTISTDASTSSTTTNSTPIISCLEPVIRHHQSTKPTVNSSTTPTVNTLCDVRMDTVATDN